MHVHEFSIGMGKAILQRRDHNGTLWSFRRILAGGYCRLAGMSEERDGEIVPLGQGFSDKSHLRQALILANGSILNIVFAAVIMFCILFFHGAPNSDRTQVGMVRSGSAAEQIGIRPGDEILRINGAFTPNWPSILSITRNIQKRNNVNSSYVSVMLLRDHKIMTVSALLPARNKNSQFGIEAVTQSFSFKESLTKCFKYVNWVSTTVFRSLVSAMTKRETVYSFAGPFRIASASGQALRNSIWSLLILISMISLNLGWMNLLPIPALDGGRLLFVGIDFVLRGRISLTVENYIHYAGFIFIVLVMLMITYSDIIYIFK